MDNEKSKFLSSVIIAVSIVAVMWMVEIYEFTTGHTFYRWGIYPRAWDGFLGIIRAPFLHSDWGHLISNSGPMIMLTTMIYYFYRRVATPSIILITVLTGFSVWLFAKDAYHIGASGVVYGLVAFVFWSGIFRRNIRSIILALVILVLFASYFLGIMPDESRANVSWESHLFGGLMGIFTAFLFKNTIEKDEIEKENPWEIVEEERVFFLPRDTFEKTKYERYLEEMERKRQEELRRREEIMRQRELRRQAEIRRQQEAEMRSRDTDNENL